MKRFTILAVVLVLIGFGSCDKCYHAKTDHYWDNGTTYNPIGECVALTCHDEGASVIEKGCPERVVLPHCRKLGYKLWIPFPDCCPPVICVALLLNN